MQVPVIGEKKRRMACESVETGVAWGRRICMYGNTCCQRTLLGRTMDEQRDSCRKNNNEREHTGGQALITLIIIKEKFPNGAISMFRGSKNE